MAFGQYGLTKLVEHIWMLIGIARTCENMVELRWKMAEMNGKTLVHFSLPWPNDKINQTFSAASTIRAAARLKSSLLGHIAGLGFAALTELFR